jgi:hypothetical protein
MRVHVDISTTYHSPMRRITANANRFRADINRGNIAITTQTLFGCTSQVAERIQSKITVPLSIDCRAMKRVASNSDPAPAMNSLPSAADQPLADPPSPSNNVVGSARSSPTSCTSPVLPESVGIASTSDSGPQSIETDSFAPAVPLVGYRIRLTDEMVLQMINASCSLDLGRNILSIDDKIYDVSVTTRSDASASLQTVHNQSAAGSIATIVGDMEIVPRQPTEEKERS